MTSAEFKQIFILVNNTCDADEVVQLIPANAAYYAAQIQNIDETVSEDAAMAMATEICA